MEQVLLGEKLRKFECQKCNACCRQPGFVYLKSEEAKRIAQFLVLDIYEFTNRYCAIEERRKLVLKKMTDESCVFLTDSGCSIQPVKPQQCINFPVIWRTGRSFSYCEGLKKLFPEL